MNTEKATLIKRLDKSNINLRRFLKLNEKTPLEKEWQKNLYEPEELFDHQNWGMCGSVKS